MIHRLARLSAYRALQTAIAGEMLSDPVALIQKLQAGSSDTSSPLTVPMSLQPTCCFNFVHSSEGLCVNIGLYPDFIGLISSVTSE
jgi:hypothetical protein